MKAAQINEQGGPEVVNVAEIDKPTAGSEEVVVEVYASSLNPFDSKLRDGIMPLQFPFTLGGDIAGIVDEVGEGVTTLKVGDKVYGSANALGGASGAFAEYAKTKTGSLAVMPSNLDFQEAASMPLVGASAWQALVTHMQVQPGQKVFIHGAGGIGMVAIQIAKHLGAYVAITATGDVIQEAKDFGADEVIDYKSDDFSTVLHDFDAVYDTVGGDDTLKATGVLKQGGILVSMVTEIDQATADEKGITAVHQFTQVTTEALDALRDLIEASIVTPNIDSVFSLDKIIEAFTVRENGTAKGKVVLAIKE